MDKTWVVFILKQKQFVWETSLPVSRFLMFRENMREIILAKHLTLAFLTFILPTRLTCLSQVKCLSWEITLNCIFDNIVNTLSFRCHTWFKQWLQSGYWSPDLRIKWFCTRMQWLTVRLKEFHPRLINGRSFRRRLRLENYWPSWVVLTFMSSKMDPWPSLMLRKRMKEITFVRREYQHNRFISCDRNSKIEWIRH